MPAFRASREAAQSPHDSTPGSLAEPSRAARHRTTMPVRMRTRVERPMLPRPRPERSPRNRYPPSRRPPACHEPSRPIPVMPAAKPSKRCARGAGTRRPPSGARRIGALMTSGQNHPNEPRRITRPWRPDMKAMLPSGPSRALPASTSMASPTSARMDAGRLSTAAARINCRHQLLLLRPIRRPIIHPARLARSLPVR